MLAYERLLKYVKIPTESAEGQGVTPSTSRQWDMAKALADELSLLGVKDVSVNEYCIVTAKIPPSPGFENAPALGFLAHMDTSPAFTGEGVKPVIHENYDGGDIHLPKEGRVIRVSEFPELIRMKGETLITADGSTLLGADDKAGIAEIMTLCEELMSDDTILHGPLSIGFTPDEEIGEGPDHFDVKSFGAKYAYTLDGDLAGGVEYENFNAAAVKVKIKGVSVHPGSAKGIMENALLIAQELNSMLPEDEIPARTEGYEGFYHLDRLEGTTAYAEMEYIIRDHDMDRFNERKDRLTRAASAVGSAHPTAGVEISIRDSYYNMRDKLKDCMHLIDNAAKAMRLAGLEPNIKPVRGGTDGARLSYMGLPCPNLGTGSCNFHGPYELSSVQQMDKTVEMLKNLVEIYAKTDAEH